MRRIVFYACALALAAASPGSPAYAKKRAPQPSSVGMVTGPKTGTYIAIGRDIAKVAADNGIRLDVKESDGSIANIKRINSTENAALGIVQSDVLGFLSRSDNPDTVRIASNLRMVLPLYKEEVHVLARKGIKDFSGLKGKRVVVGEEGSGHMLTAVNLLSMMDIKVGDTIRMTAPEGVVAVLQDEADAVIFVGGKPVRLFKNMEELKDKDNAKFAELLNEVHFLPLNEPRMLEEYQAADITPTDYAFVKESVPTIAVTAVLVSFDFSSAVSGEKKERCRMLRRLADSVRTHLDTLKASGHPKWKEVSLTDDVGIWQKDRCSWPDPAEEKRAAGKALLGIVGKPEAIPATE